GDALLSLNANSAQQLFIQAADFDVSNTYISSKFEITLEISDSPTGFLANFEYDRELFSEHSIKTYGEYFVYLLEQLITQHQEKVLLLPLEHPERTIHTITLVNNNTRAIPRDLSLIDIFENSVIKRAQACALQDNTRTLSYAQLDQQANSFAET